MMNEECFTQLESLLDEKFEKYEKKLLEITQENNRLLKEKLELEKEMIKVLTDRLAETAEEVKKSQELNEERMKKLIIVLEDIYSILEEKLDAIAEDVEKMIKKGVKVDFKSYSDEERPVTAEESLEMYKAVMESVRDTMGLMHEFYNSLFEQGEQTDVYVTGLYKKLDKIDGDLSVAREILFNMSPPEYKNSGSYSSGEIDKTLSYVRRAL